MVPRLIPFHRNEAVQNFFIVGSGRSGNTLLRRLLIDVLRAFIPPETYVLGEVIKAFRWRRFGGWERVVDGSLRDFFEHPEFVHFGVKDLKEYADVAIRIAPDRRSLLGLLDGLYRHLGERSGISFDQWGDKTPYNVFFLDQIYKTFPHSRFVFIHRDGCDVASSYVAAGIYDSLERAGRRWVAANRQILAFKRRCPDRVVQVRYEELVADHQTIVAEIGDFLDLRPREASIDFELKEKLGDANTLAHHRSVLEEVSQDHIGKGRRALSKAQKLQLAPIMDEMLARFDYLPCQAEWPENTSAH